MANPALEYNLFESDLLSRFKLYFFYELAFEMEHIEATIFYDFYNMNILTLFSR